MPNRTDNATTETVSAKPRIITSPSLLNLRKTIEYVNRNIRSGLFPEIATDHEIGIGRAKDWFLKQRRREQLCSIAMLRGDVIGASHLDIEHGRRQHTAKLAVTVDGKYRRNGVGSALVESLLALAKMEGIKRIFAEPTPSNLAAISFLEKIGFKQIGVLPQAYRRDDRTYSDLLLMSIELDLKKATS